MEYCRTLFAYGGTNEDKLTFKEGGPSWCGSLVQH